MYNIVKVTYDTDDEYRACLCSLFGTKDDTYDENQAELIMDSIYATTKDNVLYQELYDLAAAKFLSEDRSLGLSILFSYDYFALFCKCLTEDTLDATFESYISLKQIL